MSSPFCISLVQRKWVSRLSRLRITLIFFVKLGMKADRKFTDPSKLCSSCLSDGGEIDAILLTFLEHGDTPCGVMIRPKYSISLFLMLPLSGLNFSPAYCALSIISKRWISLRSSDYPCTLTSSALGNVQGMPDKVQSICSQKISEDTDSPNGRRKKQYFLNGLLNAVSSWLCLSSCFVQYPLLASSVEKYCPFMKLCCSSSQDPV